MAIAYTIGQQLHGFTVQDITELSELNLTLIQLTHDITGARMVHLDTDDTENLFSIGFRTPPADSTGIAHILEHTVLCGSENYPVRDPFFSMLKRSLNTFMNAMTASDWTMYPFASQNKKDFNNLFGIYLDAVFYPKLREQDFMQEGHRLEFATIDDSSSDLEYKGVVYNEMKGAMSDPSSLLGRRLEKSLYTKTCYHHNSGGEPSDIPSLTWEDLKNFHATYYHPSNSWIFTYGNLPLTDHLVKLETVLKPFNAIEPNSEIGLEPMNKTPKQITESYPMDAGEPTDKKSMVQVAWLTNDICNNGDRLALSLLESLLLGNPGAPLYKALLDSGLGSNLAPYTGYSDENRTTFFAAGLQGTDPDKTDAIEKLVLDTLTDIAEKGFTRERIDGVIHRLELSNKEVSGDSYPYALLLLMRMFGSWMHDNDPISPLKFDETLADIRAELDKGPYFENLIKTYLLNNPHRITLTLKPEHGLQEAEDERVKSVLEGIKSQMSDTEKDALIKQNVILKEAQEAEEDLSVLPTLTLNDIPADETRIEWTKETDGVDIYAFNAPTNGIGYFGATFETNGITDELLPYLPLFCSLLTQVGTDKYTYMQMAERKEAGTGGISAVAAITDTPDELGNYRTSVKIKGKALVRNQDKMFDILKDICTTADFTDLNRLHTVIGQIRISMENAVSGSGHAYAMKAAAGKLTPSGKIKEIWSGLSQIKLIKKVADIPEKDLGGIAEKMQQIATIIFNNKFTCGFTVEGRFENDVKQPMSRFIDTFANDTQAAPLSIDFSDNREHMGWAVSTPVSYVSQAFKTVPYTHEDSAGLTVLSKILRAGYLHREIREKGGAYGGMCSFSPVSGIMSLLSYRDPHLTRTINVYKDAIEWAADGGFTDEDIKEAILSVFSDIDKPLSPGGKGNNEYSSILQGLTPEMRKAYREKLLSVDRNKLIHVATTYLKNQMDQSIISVVSNEELLTAANKEMSELNLKIERV